mmetsp:Transcript_29940/g.62583  ORF Transcript_29940/g.62583 Transcript_29940/m.62583 type:complete len:204 (+) Transcript_29940:717-1328(+)
MRWWRWRRLFRRRMGSWRSWLGFHRRRRRRIRGEMRGRGICFGNWMCRKRITRAMEKWTEWIAETTTKTPRKRNPSHHRPPPTQQSTRQQQQPNPPTPTTQNFDSSTTRKRCHATSARIPTATSSAPSPSAWNSAPSPTTNTVVSSADSTEGAPSRPRTSTPPSPADRCGCRRAEPAGSRRRGATRWRRRSRSTGGGTGGECR